MQHVENMAQRRPKEDPTRRLRRRHRDRQGSKKKYELDKETGFLMLDRILHTATHYPANYGLIPRTYGDDKDPLDVLVLCSEPIEPMTLVVRCNRSVSSP
jgi:inorganic pyrophosphatase